MILVQPLKSGCSAVQAVPRPHGAKSADRNSQPGALDVSAFSSSALLAKSDICISPPGLPGCFPRSLVRKWPTATEAQRRSMADRAASRVAHLTSQLQRCALQPAHALQQVLRQQTRAAMAASRFLEVPQVRCGREEQRLWCHVQTAHASGRSSARHLQPPGCLAARPAGP